MMDMKQILRVVMLSAVLLPMQAEAKFNGDVAAWVPWWTGEEGVESADEHLREFDILYPFTYEVNSDGTLKARAELDKGDWEDLIDDAKDRDIKVMPTVMWFDGDQIHEVLSNRKKRNKHIDEIVDMVKDGDFDGVNIDYEGKNAETIDYFSRFLKDLEDELGRDDLSCTIEARTPPEDLYKEIPDPLRYANDYEAINRYCDWVEIMAYDQQRADLTLNKERRGVPYAPVADKDWVEKVIKLALKDIDEDKILLGIPTYGRAWDVTVASEWYKSYKRVAALNHPRIMELSEEIYEVPIGRTEGGEAVISYFPEDSKYKILNALPVPEDTPRGFEAAAKALWFATKTGVEVEVRFVTWSDAQAIEKKIELADKYDLMGIALFSINGEEDPDMWRKC